MRIFNVIFLTASVLSAGPLKIDSVVVRHDPKLMPFVGSRIFEKMNGTLLKRNASAAFSSILEHTPFLSDAADLTLARFDGDAIAGVITLNPKFNSHISGMIGSGKNQTGSWESQGEFNIHLENLWATAGALGVSWHRRNAESQFTEITLSEPYLPVVPVGLHFGWKEHLQEGMSLLRSTEMSALNQSGSGWMVRAGFRKTSIRPTDAGLKEGAASSSSETAAIGVSKNTLNRKWLPTNGFSITALAEFGIENRLEKKSSITSADVEANYFHPFSDSWVLLAAAKGFGTFSGSGSILPAQQTRFGGMQSLRGYRDDFFRADWAVIPTFEMRYAALTSLQISGFIESAFHDSPAENPVTMGIGIIQKTDAAVLSVFYGLAKGNAPADGVIHIKLTGLL